MQDSTKFPNLSLFPYLDSPEHELNYLRQVSEVLLCTCLSRDLLECTLVRVLIREYLACQILLPTIEMLCDPDYINQKLLADLVKKEEATKSARKRPAYADFEDFMKHVSKSEDVNELQQIRESIITDIIQAKAVHKMMSSRLTGLHGRQFPIPIPADKVKSLMERDLDVYLNQLSTAKGLSERQLRKLGVEDYTAAVTTDMFSEDLSAGPLGIPFETIMKNEVARMYLFQFMEICGFGSLLTFWVSVGELSTVPSSLLRKSLTSLYNEHLSPSSFGSVHLEASVLSSIKDTLDNDSQACLKILNKVRSDIYEEIYELFYQNFIYSCQYKELMQQPSGDGLFPSVAGFAEASLNETADDSQHKQKLYSLKYMLEKKDNELSLMPEVRSSRSLTQRKKALQKDRSQLSEEIKKLEHYIDHTEEWFGTIGQWSIQVHSVDVSKADKYDQDPLFVMVIHRPELARKNKARSISTSSLSSLEESSLTPHLSLTKTKDGVASMVDSEEGAGTASEISESSDGAQAGWVIGRRLSEFEELHEKVSQVCPNLKFPPLPKRLFPFIRVDAQSSYWTKYCQALQGYLNMVMQDDRLQESEEVFIFLSPVSDNLRKSSMIRREKRSLANRLSSFPVPSFPGNKEQEEDPITEQMFIVVSEVFELDQWSRVLRKQLVELVQLTYGKSIDRQLQEFMSWVVSESMLVYYLEVFRDSMWPEGKPGPPSPTRSDSDKAYTRDEAKKRFLKSSPQALQTILGQRNCQIGFGKIFESLQDPRGNKQLFYSMLEIFMYALIPELQTVEIDENGPDWKS